MDEADSIYTQTAVLARDTQEARGRKQESEQQVAPTLCSCFVLYSSSRQGLSGLNQSARLKVF